jgi:hypothetical protein
LGYAKQKDLLATQQNILAVQKNVSEVKKDISTVKDNLSSMNKDLNGKIDTLAMAVVRLDEGQSQFDDRLTRVEVIVEKTYKLLDTHVKTQIRFDHELAARRNIMDGHGKRISALEAKG